MNPLAPEFVPGSAVEVESDMDTQSKSGEDNDSIDDASDHESQDSSEENGNTSDNFNDNSGGQESSDLDSSESEPVRQRRQRQPPRRFTYDILGKPGYSNQ